MSEKLLMKILEKVTTIEREQSQFKQALFELHEMGSETNRVVAETNATVKRIEMIQEEQHHIIDLLSTRSIEHEATLKRIK